MTGAPSGQIHGNPPPPLELAIIGGGIGGLSLLLGILRHTSPEVIRPHLYEAAGAFSEIGAGVGFGPNSVRAMKIVDPRLHDAYDRIASDSEMVTVNGKEMAQWHQFLMGMDGRGLNTLKSGDLINRVYNNNKKKNVHRATFLDEMINLLPGGTGQGFVTFGKRCDRITDDGKSGVCIYFEDGTSATASAAIGCDGVKSRVRQELFRWLGTEHNLEPRFTGKYAYRGLIPMEEAIAAVGPVAKQSHMFWGYGGHLVCFPIDKGATLNVVAFQTKVDGGWEQPDWVVPGTVEQCLADFQDWSKPVKDLLANLKKPNVWALFEHPPADSYYAWNKLCLLGDCAHASTPHQGAGAGMAIEDAAVLSRLLGIMSSPSEESLQKVFHAYDAVRRPRSQRLVTTSRDAGLLYDFQKEGVLDDPHKLRKDIDQRLRWIWDIDLEEHCREAIEIMRS